MATKRVRAESEELTVVTEPTLPQLAAAVMTAKANQATSRQILDKAVAKLEAAKTDVATARAALTVRIDEKKKAAAALRAAAVAEETF